MANCYTLKSPNQNLQTTQKPKAEVLHAILNFSKSYEVVTSEKKKIGFVLN
ncbi:MAG: hypothetical protein R3279_11815 [Putridiphycobacter sp.]|jgi:hypothetical protein|nr:hypothetical protein [Putridiphycobacter sp.]